MLGVFHDSGFPVSAQPVRRGGARSSSRRRCRRSATALRGAPARRRRRGGRARPAPGVGCGDRRVRRPGPSAAEVVRNLLAGGLLGAAAPRRRGRRAGRCRGRRRARGDRRAGGRGHRGRARLRRQGRARPRRAHAGLRRGRRTLLAVCRAAGHAHGGPELPRRRKSARRAQRDVAPGAPTPGQRRLRLPERGVGDRGDRRGGGARDRVLVVRVDGRQGRPLRQRLPRVLGAGPRHVGAAALPGVVRQPAPVRADRAADHDDKPIVAVKSGRTAADAASSHTARCRRRRHRRRTVRARRRAARRDGGGDVRRRAAARAPATADRRPRGGADQRRGPGVLCADACEAGACARTPGRSRPRSG